VPVLDRPDRAVRHGHLVVPGNAAEQDEVGALPGGDVSGLARALGQGPRERNQVLRDHVTAERLDQRADSYREAIAVLGPGRDVADGYERLHQVVRGGAAQSRGSAQLLRSETGRGARDRVENRGGARD
jgi:hypothetical protein